MIVFVRNTIIVMVLVILAFMVFKVGVFGLAPAEPCSPDQYLQGFDKETGEPVCKPLNKTDPSQTNTAPQNIPPVVQADIDANIAAERAVGNSVDSGDNFTGK